MAFASPLIYTVFMVLKAFIRFGVTAGVLLLISHFNFVPGIVVADFGSACFAAFVWGILSLTIRPVLRVLTLPISILTLGLFSFVLNAGLFWAMSFIVPGFSVHGFIPALEGSVILSLAGLVLHSVL